MALAKLGLFNLVGGVDLVRVLLAAACGAVTHYLLI
jgi:hypothetical protein